MKKLQLISILLLFAFITNAQIKAITESGDEVLLYESGTWEYVDDKLADKEEVIPINDKKFYKNKNATFLVKSNNINIGIWINPKEWSFEKTGENESTEFSFQKRNETLYAMIITENIELPIESLKDIALQNAKNASPDAKIVFQEYRYVNDTKIFYMHIKGTIQGIKFYYVGYYYSDENGTTQFIAYTTQNLFEQYKNDMLELLNGFVIL